MIETVEALEVVLLFQTVKQELQLHHVLCKQSFKACSDPKTCML